MWFAFGLVTMSLTIVVAYYMRRTSRWVGTRESYQRAAGEWRNYEVGEARGKHGPTMYRLGISSAHGFEFSLRKENGLDAFGKSLGIVAEQSTADARFDRRVFIDSSDLRVGKALRNDAPLRLALLTLIDRCDDSTGGFRGLRSYRGRLWLELGVKSGKPGGEIAEALADTLYQLRAALLEQATTSPKGNDPFIGRATVLLAISTGSLIFGVLAIIRVPFSFGDLQSGSLWVVSIGIGALLGLLLGYLGARWLMASSRAHYVLAETLTLGMLGAVLSCHALFRELNREFDDAEPRVFAAMPAAVWTETYRCGKSRRSTCERFWLTIQGDWPHTRKSTQIDHRTYARIAGHERVDIRVKPGLLGFPWIERIDPSRAPKSIE